MFGSDIDEEQVDATIENLDAARLNDIVAVTTGYILDITPPIPKGIMITNPQMALDLAMKTN